MSRKCKISGKGPQNGHKVSHSNNKTNKVSYPNLQTKRLFDSVQKRWVKVKVSARMMRTIDKKGLSAALKDNGLRLADLA
jgi:large subunit ribosomal protein L28